MIWNIFVLRVYLGILVFFMFGVVIIQYIIIIIGLRLGLVSEKEKELGGDRFVDLTVLFVVLYIIFIFKNLVIWQILMVSGVGKRSLVGQLRDCGRKKGFWQIVSRFYSSYEFIFYFIWSLFFSRFYFLILKVVGYKYYGGLGRERSLQVGVNEEGREEWENVFEERGYSSNFQSSGRQNEFSQLFCKGVERDLLG